MTQIIQNGSISAAALVVPDALVQIVPPSVTQLNGVPTNVIGIVGTASWGPKNSPQPFSGATDYGQTFGPVKARKYDMGTMMATAVITGGNNFLGVRVTDGNDLAATAVLYNATGVATAGGTGHVTGDLVTFPNGAQVSVTANAGVVSAVAVTKAPTTNTAGALAQSSTTGVGIGLTVTFTYSTGVTATSLYTGSLANGDTLEIAVGSAANSFKAIVSRPGRVPEVFDNITGTGNAFWVNLATAINNGQSGIRSASALIVLSAGASTTTPTPQVYTLAAGADGDGVTQAQVLGVDGVARTGLYALRNSAASIGICADCDTSTTWSAQVALGLAEAIYMMVTGPAGQTVTAGASAKAAAGLDSYAVKYLLGDWCYFNDTANGQPQRLVSPQGYAAGRLANLGPQESGLNKPIFGLVATQRSLAGQPYAAAELLALSNAGIDVICNPAPGGPYFALRFGRNGSSRSDIHGDNYTRLTNYIAKTIASGIGPYIGQIQTADERLDAKASLDGLFENMASTTPTPMISNPQGTQPWLVVLDDSNNPASSVSTGHQIADVKVQYGSIIETFLVNLEGGQSVVIRTPTQLSQLSQLAA